jgi:hypothetical protein
VKIRYSRRFAAHPLGLTVDVVISEQIADQKDPDLGEALEEG